jgi:serine O-acetyltransferase
MSTHVDPRTVHDRTRLSQVVDALRALRKASQQSRYRNGAPPQLPAREVVAEIVQGLVACLFPRHFGPSDITIDNVDGFIAYTLDATLRSLREQVRRELALFDEGKESASGPQQEKQADVIASAFAAALPKVRALLDSDIRAAFNGDPAARSLDEVIFCYPGVAAIMRHRLAHELYLNGAFMLARIVAEIAHAQTGIDIHPGAEIDESFFIDHGTGVVIGETARIGKRVRLYQAVTLGAKRFEQDETGALVKGQPRHPILEDDVVIYAGATVLGRIVIGRGSAIGGNVWLTRSVPPGSNITQAQARVETFDGGAGI